MQRRTFLQVAGAGALAKKRPNIVLFVADDHGVLDSPVYGNKIVRTPHLERLARAGMVFQAAFAASPTCVPSRANLMSGMYSARNGAERNHSGLAAGIQTLPTYLKELGYTVAHFGKSHFQPRENYPDMLFVPSEIKGGPLNNDLDPGALDAWLAKNAGSSQPLCLIVGCHSPHVYWPENEGYDPAEVDLPPTFVDTPETRAERAKYYTDITKADMQFGQVYDSCRKHLGGDTAVFYTSDNGAQWPFAKWSLYDAGIRMPFVVSWPGMVRPGSRTRAMVSFVDVLPTFVEMAGGRTPSGIDGRSFVRVLRDGSARHRAEIFAAHSGDGDMNVYPMRCVRTARYKYILNVRPEFVYGTHIDRAGARDGRAFFDSWVSSGSAVVRRYMVHPSEELYDVREDPHEMRNLAGEAGLASVLAELRGKVRDWMRLNGDTGRIYGRPRLVE